MLRKAERPAPATTAVAALAMLALGATLALVAHPWVAARVVVETTIFVLPGLLLLRAAAGPAAGWLPVLAFGPFVGFGLSSLALLGLWLAGGHGTWTLLASPALVLALVPLARQLQGRWRLPVTMPGDPLALAALVLMLPLVVGAPFAHVRGGSFASARPTARTSPPTMSGGAR